MSPQVADMFELPVVVKVPSDETVMGPVNWPPSGKVMIMFTVELVGSPRAEVVQTWSRTTAFGEIEQPVPPPGFPFVANAAAGANARARKVVATAMSTERV